MKIFRKIKCFFLKRVRKKTYQKKFTEEERILNILKTVDKVHPEKDKNFIAVIPKLHLYPKAIDILNIYGNLATTYSVELLKYSTLGIPFSVEKILIQAKNTNLLYYLKHAGHTYSNEAKELIKEYHPNCYEHLS